MQDSLIKLSGFQPIALQSITPRSVLLPKRYQSEKESGYDVFVTKLSPAGDTLTYATFLGGYDEDYGFGIALDGFGYAYVTGQTFSPNFPIQKPYMEYWGAVMSSCRNLWKNPHTVTGPCG